MPRPSGTVTLDIGGRNFKTTIQTLSNYPESFFGRMFSGNWSPHKDERGHVFIDRNGDLFVYILAFMRDGTKVELPKERAILHDLRIEADFYAIGAMVELIDRKLREPNRVITLNIGGREFPVTVRTLQRAPQESILSRLTTEEGIAMEDERGRIFIDRDGKLFDFVLEYLRTGEIDFPQDSYNRFLVRKLEKECMYYHLPGMRECLYDRLHPWRHAFDNHKRSISSQCTKRKSLSLASDAVPPTSNVSLHGEGSVVGANNNNDSPPAEDRVDPSDDNASHLSVTI